MKVERPVGRRSGGLSGRRLTAQTAEAGRQGHRHAVRELSIVGGAWGFDLADVRVPDGVWHGALDRTVPVASSAHLGDAVPGASLTVHDDVGHLSLPVEHATEILQFLTRGRRTRRYKVVLRLKVPAAQRF